MRPMRGDWRSLDERAPGRKKIRWRGAELAAFISQREIPTADFFLIFLSDVAPAPLLLGPVNCIIMRLWNKEISSTYINYLIP